MLIWQEDKRAENLRNIIIVDGARRLMQALLKVHVFATRRRVQSGQHHAKG